MRHGCEAMTKSYFNKLIERAAWRLKMTWHYLLAVAAILLMLIITDDISGKTGIFCLLVSALGFMLMDVPLEHRTWKGKELRPKSRKVSKQQNVLYQQMIEALPEPIIILDRNHQILFSNKAAQTVFGVKRQGQDITAQFRTPELSEALLQLARSRESQVIQLFERVPIERHFKVRLSWIEPLKNNQKEKVSGQAAIMVHFNDLTEQERLNRMRSDFIANASHELRTPLASLLGFIDTLQGAAKDDPAAREKFLTVMAAQGQRMTRLIDDLLSLSRIEMNAHRRPDRKVKLLPIIANTIDILQPLAEAQGLEIILEAEEETYELIGNRDELAQVFQNLIQNAIKYGKPLNSDDGVIRVRVRAGQGHYGQQKPRIRVEVEDEGIGIDPIHIPRLTERFYRVDVQQSKEKGGTGLGLAIAKHIITNHRGELKIKSRLGEGATFTVLLPRA